jgi:hypothetical protein
LLGNPKDWIEDELPEPEPQPYADPVGYVETLPVPRRRRRKRKPRDVVKMGWGSERLNRRAKG